VLAFRKEVHLLRNLNHQNLVRFYAACTKCPPEGQLCIVMELMVGSLADLLYGDKSKSLKTGVMHEMSDKRLLAIAWGVTNGMRYLHSHHVCHRDLKSLNVLYDQSLSIKLCDFAFSKFKEQLDKKTARFQTSVGTPQWMAPEVLRGEEYTFSADVHSFGVILWEMLARCQPFSEYHAHAIMCKVGCEGLRLNPPKNCPAFWKGLMQLCWRPAKERPTFDQIMEMLKQVKEELTEAPR
jgi:serine/threonine protein kinase